MNCINFIPPHTSNTSVSENFILVLKCTLSFLQENIRAGRHVLCCTGALRWLRCDREQNRSRLSQESFVWSRLHCGLHVRVHRSWYCCSWKTDGRSECSAAGSITDAKSPSRRIVSIDIPSLFEFRIIWFCILCIVYCYMYYVLWKWLQLCCDLYFVSFEFFLSHL